MPRYSSGSRGRRRGVAVAAAVLIVAGTGPAFADLEPDPLRVPAHETGQTLDRNVLAKAQPEECFYGEDAPVGPISDDGTCPDITWNEQLLTGQPRVPQAYLWGLTKANNSLWFGTVANVLCLAAPLLLGGQPITTESFSCQPQATTLTGTKIGDFRPPQLYRYDESTGELSRLTPSDSAMLRSTLGIRSAGNAGGVVFLGGPARGGGLAGGGGINLFAFDATTGAALGAHHYDQYTDIRQWLSVGDQLYTGVAYTEPTVDAAPAAGLISTQQENGFVPAGKVLRWTGSKDNPFSFEEVGTLDASAANLALHKGHIFVNTWPAFLGQASATGTAQAAQATAPPPAGVWMSPPLPEDNTLTSADAGNWQKVWSVADFEPDPVTALSYAGGALRSYAGKLYWGTMHLPAGGALLHQMVYGGGDLTNIDAQTLINTHRAVAMFRADFTSPSDPVQVLYGNATESVYDPGTDTWSRQPTGGRNGTPTGGGIYGTAGFGDPFNAYDWSMSVFGGQLYVGTFDFSYLLQDLAQSNLPDQTKTLLSALWLALQVTAGPTPGADLWRFPSGTSPAVAESRQGVGNYSNYGVRTMVGDDTAGALYIGTANPMNLMTSKTDDRPEGGWELLKLTVPVTPPPGGGGGGGAPAPQAFTFSRLAGADRYATAAAVARATYPGGATQVVLANGERFPDAMSGSYLAGLVDGPILLTAPNGLPEPTVAALRSLGASSVHVLGGTGAVSDRVVTQLRDAGYAVSRVAGADRYVTAARVAGSGGAGAVGVTDSARTAIVTSGENFPDGLTAGPLAYARSLPILLTRSGELPSATATALSELGIKHVLVAGGPEAVSPAVVNRIVAMGITAERLAGDNRAETATEVADYAVAELGFTAAHVNLTRGDTFPDALAGAPHGGVELAATLLTQSPTANAPATLAWLHAHAATLQDGHVLGGPAAVSDAVLHQAEQSVTG